MTSKIGINENLKFREEIVRLKKLYVKIYDENQRMKRRLAKHEGSRRMVTYWNEKEKYENNNIGTTGNREDNNVVEPSRRVHTARN
jgi:hypothetical protein